MHWTSARFYEMVTYNGTYFILHYYKRKTEKMHEELYYTPLPPSRLRILVCSLLAHTAEPHFMILWVPPPPPVYALYVIYFYYTIHFINRDYSEYHLNFKIGHKSFIKCICIIFYWCILILFIELLIYCHQKVQKGPGRGVFLISLVSSE